jgi:hypothetical protein
MTFLVGNVVVTFLEDKDAKIKPETTTADKGQSKYDPL